MVTEKVTIDLHCETCIVLDKRLEGQGLVALQREEQRLLHHGRQICTGQVLPYPIEHVVHQIFPTQQHTQPTKVSAPSPTRERCLHRFWPARH